MSNTLLYILAVIVFSIAFGVGLFYDPKSKSRSRER